MGVLSITWKLLFMIIILMLIIQFVFYGISKTSNDGTTRRQSEALAIYGILINLLFIPFLGTIGLLTLILDQVLNQEDKKNIETAATKIMNTGNQVKLNTRTTVGGKSKKR